MVGLGPAPAASCASAGAAGPRPRYGQAPFPPRDLSCTPPLSRPFSGWGEGWESRDRMEGTPVCSEKQVFSTGDLGAEGSVVEMG